MIKLAATGFVGRWSASGWPPCLPAATRRRPTARRRQGQRQRQGKAKKKGEREPRGELRKAYDLLRRLRADDGSRGPPRGAAPRLDRPRGQALPRWPEGLRARATTFLAREYGAAAHDLARAVDHARNAARFDRRRPRPAAALRRLRPRGHRRAGPPRPEPRLRADRLAWATGKRTPGSEVLRQGGPRPLQRRAARRRGRPRRAGRRARPRGRGDDPRARAPRPGRRRTAGRAEAIRASSAAAAERACPSRPRPRGPSRAPTRARRCRRLLPAGVSRRSIDQGASRPRPRRRPGPFRPETPSRRGQSHHGLAEPHRTLRLVLPRHGGDRLHPALPAALPRREGALGPRDRDRLDAGGAVGPGPVPGRTLVRPDRLAQAVPGRRAGGAGRSRPCFLRGAHGVVWLGFLVILFAENGICRAVVESLSGAEAAALARQAGGRRRPRGPPVLEADRHRRWWPCSGAGCRSGTASARSCCRLRSCRAWPSSPRS